MKSKVIKWGILGGAWIAKERMIPAIHAAKNNKIIAIASRNKKKSLMFADTFHIPRVYESYEELLRDPDIDAVYIPLPNHLHAKWTILSAQAGKHVLCEKPAALHVKEVVEMVSACRNHNVLFMEAFAFRCHPEWHRLKEMLVSGYIGDIRNVQARYSIMVKNEEDIRLNPALGGGVLFDIGSYCVNGIRYIMGDEPLDVQGFARFDHHQIDISMAATMEFPSGRLAQFDCTFESEYNQSLEISGTTGIIKIKFPFRDPQLSIQKNGKEETLVFQERINPYVSQVEHFSNCIITGNSPCYHAEESIANIQVIHKIYESVKQSM